ncbi:MAG: DNA internalization-related competence protein ComEC/Rec2 [Candidatus Eremiobacteraeota bacterium]|nr:DNA internalization-related competence protein ComEC/Rec2 [Candidatus Eremiobacteraeota bacterium]
MRERPVIAMAILFSAGILTASLRAPGFLIALVLLFAGLIAARCARIPDLCCLLMCVCFFAGLVSYRVRDHLHRHSPLRAFAGRPVSIRGTILAADDSLSGARLKVALQWVTCSGKKVEVPSVRILVKAAPAADHGGLVCGDQIEAYGVLREYLSLRNPGLFNNERARRFDGYGYELEIRRPGALVWRGRGAVNPLIWMASYMRSSMEKVFKASHASEKCALLSGIVFGDKSAISDDLQEQFRVTGTLHLLAASGMNVALLTCTVLALCRLLGLSRRHGSLLALPVIVVYTFMAGATPCIVRASLMASLCLLARLARREADLANTLFCAAFVMMAVSPQSLFDIGFQLSCGAVAGIIIGVPLFQQCWERKKGLLRYFLELFLISCAVQLILTPLVAFHFFQCAPLSCFFNLVVVPPAVALLHLGILEGILGLLWLPLGAPCAFLNELALSFMLWAEKTLSSVPGCSLPVVRPSWSLILWYYLIVASLAVLKTGYGSVLLRRVLAWAIVICGLLAPWPGFSAMPFKVIVMDVGEGDAILICLPDSSAILIDGGAAGKNGFDAGERVVVPLLKAQGIRRLGLVMLSHRHDDHAGGLVSVLKAIPTGLFVHGPGCTRGGIYGELVSMLSARTIPEREAYAGDEFLFPCGARLRVLWPPRDFTGVDENDMSLVVQLVYRETRMLFMGDLGGSAEEQFLCRPHALQSQVLKIAHHGSSLSTKEKLLGSAAPEYALISVGRRNIHGHPSRKVIERLEKKGIRVLRTDCSGAVTLILRGNALEVQESRDACDRAGGARGSLLPGEADVL